MRLYADTSVFGGCFDDEFALPSRRLFAAIASGKFKLVISELIINELSNAPEKVQRMLTSLSPALIETTEINAEVLALSGHYLSAAIVTPRSENDAVHVAAATVARVNAIVSWNFKHIVALDKMPAYNRVNIAHAYDILTIITPAGVHYDN